MRADAKRNYDRLVEAARAVFREQGYDASLDEVAKRAGVGPGTLYRHFPNRDALLDAIMQSWVDSVGEAVEKTLAFEGPPRDLLLGWFQEYVRLISMHKGGPAKITSAMGDPDSPILTKCQVLRGAHDQVIAALREQGALRDDVETLQVIRLVGGVATVADQSELDEAAVLPLLEVVADGLVRYASSVGVHPSAWTPRTRPRALLRRDGRRRTRPLRCPRPASTAPPVRRPTGVRGCGGCSPRWSWERWSRSDWSCCSPMGATVAATTAATPAAGRRPPHQPARPRRHRPRPGAVPVLGRLGRPDA